MRDQALAQAREADAALSKGNLLGPFHGVPFCIKESFAVKGQPDTWGIVALKDSKATANSTVVQRLLDNGAVLVGGTNVPLNLMDWQSFNDIYGTTNNPWDVSRTPGGSSGGSAAALAAGLSYLSIGGDMTTRVIDTRDGKRPYMQLMPWMVTATLTGCPATVMPIGETSSGLPVGLQILGPFWEDATPIEFAALLSDQIGGFKAPPGYGA